MSAGSGGSGSPVEDESKVSFTKIGSGHGAKISAAS